MSSKRINGDLTVAGRVVCDTVVNHSGTAVTTATDSDLSGNLTVAGTTTLTGGLTANGGISADGGVFSVANTTGNIITTGTLAVTGASTLTGNTGVTGTLTVTGVTALNGGITCDTNAFTVADTSGNTAIAGTLAVTGATALNGGLTMDTNKFTVADTSGNVLTAGTLTVAGVAALNGGITCDTSAFTVADTTGAVSCGDITCLGGDIDAGASGTAGSVDVFPATGSKGKLAITCTDQTGDTTVSLVAGAMAAARTVTLRDPGAAASFLTTTDATAAATTATAVELNYLDITTLGTGAASKAVVLDSGDDYTWPATGVLTYGVLKDPAATTILATGAEINRACDNSTRIVAITASGAISEAAHSDKVCLLAEEGGNALVTLTLPEATGSGMRLKFIVSVVNTSSYVFVVADTTNANFIGNVINQDADLVGTIAAITYLAPANADTLTLNGTTTGGQKGDWIELIDVATDVWFATGIVSCPAGSDTANCFTAAV